MNMSVIPSYQQELVRRTRQMIERGRSAPLSTIQSASLAGPGIPSAGWSSRQVFPASAGTGDGPMDLITKCISALGGGVNDSQPKVLPYPSVDLQWTGPRQGQSSNQSGPSTSEFANFQNLMSDVKNPLTVMFFHGGSFTMSSPERYQKVFDYFAETTGGRCVAFRYHLAPQSPFPAALLDALVAYLTLLHPPSSAFHVPVSASSIVFVGDSAGANLALSLLQVILFAQRSSLSVPFNGVQVNLPSPAGVSLLSAGLELTLALPSWHNNANFDIFLDTWSMLDPEQRACKIWPSKPPRGHPYCETNMLDHPLVAPAVAEDWKGSPPMWFAGGQERFADSAKLAAEHAAQQGVEVWYEEYEQMPHDFPIMGVTWPSAVTDDWPQSLECMRSWARVCVRMVEGCIESGAVVKGLGSEKTLDVIHLTGLSFPEALRLIRAKKAAWKDWRGKVIKSSL